MSSHQPSCLAYELVNGNLQPFLIAGSDLGHGCPNRSGRKSRTTLYTLQQVHAQAVATLKHREQRDGRVSPPPELTERKALPLIASYLLWRLGHDLGRYLSPATHVLHRRLLREYTGIDIGQPFDDA